MLDDISRIDSAVLKPDLVKVSRDRGGAQEKHKGHQTPGQPETPPDEEAETQDRLDDGEPRHLLDVRI
jgi:hypothetical protein